MSAADHAYFPRTKRQPETVADSPVGGEARRCDSPGGGPDFPAGWWHEEAKRLRAEGWVYVDIAQHLDKGLSTVIWALSEKARETTRQRVRRNRARKRAERQA